MKKKGQLLAMEPVGTLMRRRGVGKQTHTFMTMILKSLMMTTFTIRYTQNNTVRKRASLQFESALSVIALLQLRCLKFNIMILQLIRELIERKMSYTEGSDPTAMGRQWLELQKLRNKAKKKVDTKASKGRKIRSVVAS